MRRVQNLVLHVLLACRGGKEGDGRKLIEKGIPQNLRRMALVSRHPVPWPPCSPLQHPSDPSRTCIHSTVPRRRGEHQQPRIKHEDWCGALHRHISVFQLPSASSALSRQLSLMWLLSRESTLNNYTGGYLKLQLVARNQSYFVQAQINVTRGLAPSPLLQ